MVGHLPGHRSALHQAGNRRRRDRHGPFRLPGLLPLGVDRQPDRQSGKLLRRYRNFREMGFPARYHRHHRYRDVCYLLHLQRCRRVGVPEHHHRPEYADLLRADRSAVRRWRSHCLQRRAVDPRRSGAGIPGHQPETDPGLHPGR